MHGTWNTPEHASSHRVPVSAPGSKALVERHSEALTLLPPSLPPSLLPRLFSSHTILPSLQLSQAGKTWQTSKSSLSRRNRIRHERIPRQGPSEDTDVHGHGPFPSFSFFFFPSHIHFLCPQCRWWKATKNPISWMNLLTTMSANILVLLKIPRWLQCSTDDVLFVSRGPHNAWEFKQSAGNNGKQAESTNQQQRDTVGTL